MAKNNFTILLGGSLTPTERLKQQTAGSRSIAADSGIAHAMALGLVPELWVGDFDSADASLHSRYREVPRLEFSPSKDMSDGEIAIEEAVRRGAKSLVLAASFGEQSDHALAHIMLADLLSRRGLDVLMSSGHEEGWPIKPGNQIIELPPGTNFSVIPLDELHGLCLKGARWPLENRKVARGSTLTLSNVALGPVEVQLGRGSGIVMAYPEGN